MPDYYNYIIRHGFIPKEAKAFVTAKSPDGTPQDFEAVFNSAPFQDMLKHRLSWVTSIKAQGYSGHKIAAAVEKFFYQKEGGRTPFDFLKIEYRPPQQMTDYAFAVQVRAKSRITRMSTQITGKRYSPKIKREWRPKDPLI